VSATKSIGTLCSQSASRTGSSVSNRRLLLFIPAPRSRVLDRARSGRANYRRCNRRGLPLVAPAPRRQLRAPGRGSGPNGYRARPPRRVAAGVAGRAAPSRVRSRALLRPEAPLPRPIPARVTVTHTRRYVSRTLVRRAGPRSRTEIARGSVMIPSAVPRCPRPQVLSGTLQVKREPEFPGGGYSGVTPRS
jgi:hypothetical protein